MHTEDEIGIFSYLSKSPGIGGKIRTEIDDFYVEEIPINIERDEKGKHLYLKIKLRNWETNRFVKLLSRELGISRRRIRFTGMKDKRGISVQYFCIMNYEGDIKTNLRDVEIIDSFRSNHLLNIGELIGNKFKILVEDAICDERVKKIEEELNGFFPNYFGVQRFGAVRPITHIVGKFIVMGDFKNAVRYYIGYFPGEDEGRKIFYENMDERESLKNIGNGEYEKAILNHLIKKPEDYIGALKSLPQNLLLLFIHAYQGYLFNKMISERVKEGVDLRDGDVIMKVDNYGIPKQEFAVVNSFNIDKIRKRIEEKKAYISTILFGYESRFTGGIQGEIEKKIIEEEGIKKENFRIREIPEISSKGRRRNILARIMDYKREDCNFQFSLYRGSYATSLLREFMKRKELEYY